MKALPIVLRANEIAPNGNMLSQDIFAFLEEIFKAGPLVKFEDNGYYYTQESINDLAKDIVNILEKKN